MNHQPVSVELSQKPLDVSQPLSEHMDDAIGEATSVMGTMLTEVIRRSLRGGVMKIGEVLSSFVTERVNTTISQKTPVIEQIAEQTAHLTAAKVASEEVHSLAERTGEATRADAQIQETDQRAQQAASAVTQTLSGRIEETERRTRTATEELAQGLVRQIEDVDRKAGETTRVTAQELGSRIVETEKRVCEVTQTEIDQRVQELMARSRKGGAVLKARLRALQGATANLSEQLSSEQQARRAEIQESTARVQQSLEHIAKDLGRALEQCQAQLGAEMRELRLSNEKLGARIAELERPRGLRALWQRLFGRKPKVVAE